VRAIIISITCRMSPSIFCSLRVVTRSLQFARAAAIGVFTAFVVQLCVIQVAASADYVSRHGGGEFKVPKKLRPRVDFWVDIFTKYSRDTLVIHHRDFPQAVFGVVDLSGALAGLSAGEKAKARERLEKREIKAVEEALRHLAVGGAPKNQLEERIASELKFLPGGDKKYMRMLTDDLVRSQSGIRERYGDAIARSSRYLPAMEQIFLEYGLPVELTRLPFIESSFDYSAYSSVGAAGIWQFMRRTGKSFMTINSVVDERRDPISATKAAARYLEAAYRDLGTWPLAITSYNHGVAGVARKVREFGSTNIAEIVESPNTRVFGFASTNFYPEFLAAVEVYENRKQYFPEIKEEPALRFDQVRLAQGISASRVAARIGVRVEELKRYNYSLSEAVWKGRALIPSGFNLKVPAGLGGRALDLGKPVQRERSVAKSSVQKKVSTPTKLVKSTPKTERISYKVRKGDTLSSIAKRYKVTIQAVKSSNGLTRNILHPGQVLVIQRVKK
jgi:membrane-bound lytic murein transglycosylase D